jgi:hypothetical protein
MWHDLAADDRRWDHLIQTWSPAIGRLRWTGWILCVAYVAATLLCLRSWRASFRPDPRGWSGYRIALATSLGLFGRLLGRENSVSPNRRIAFLWFLMGACLLLLAVNRAIGLEDWLTISARNLAVANGWYERRRLFQVLAVILSLVAALFTWPIVIWLGGGRLRFPELRLALGGSLFLLAFAAVRACSFHYIDRLLALSLEGFHLGGMVELAALVVVGLAAAKFPTRIVYLDRADRSAQGEES